MVLSRAQFLLERYRKHEGHLRSCKIDNYAMHMLLMINYYGLLNNFISFWNLERIVCKLKYYKQQLVEEGGRCYNHIKIMQKYMISGKYDDSLLILWPTFDVPK